MVTNPILALMATPDRKVKVLAPSLQSMNKLLMEMVNYQVQLSARRFWSDIRRAGINPEDFNQLWFAAWKNQEVEKLNVDYVYNLFKKFVRSVVTTEGAFFDLYII